MYFIEKKVFTKRLAIFGLICVGYVFAVLNLGGYSRAFANYKPYYLKSYLFAFNYTAGNAFSLIASPIASLLHPTVASGDEETLISAQAQSVPVLLYHGILSKTDGENVTLETFTNHMLTLKNAGYSTVTVDDLYQFLSGKKQLPKKSFLLTFDDGRKDSYYPADPILRALGFNAVMFTIANFASLEKSDYYLSKEEIQAMADSSRWQIESHTRTHRNLVGIPNDELSDEISGSRQILENLIGKPVTAFAFPFGEAGQEATDLTGSNVQSERQIIGMATSTYAMSFFQFFTTKRFTQNYTDPLSVKNNYLVHRIEPQPDWTNEHLLTLLQGGNAKSLPFFASLTSSDGWINTLWGDMKIANNTLSVHSLKTTTGSAIVLDGTRLWKDYEFNTTVDSRSGSNIYLWARYQDDNNYIACNFGNGLVHVEQTLHGSIDVLKGVEVVTPRTHFTAGVRVNGRTVSCLINGEEVASTAYSDSSLDSGGIGLKVWDALPGVSGLSVSNVSVRTLSQ